MSAVIWIGVVFVYSVGSAYTAYCVGVMTDIEEGQSKLLSSLVIGVLWPLVTIIVIARAVGRLLGVVM